jgi:hypothetical protein
MADIGRPKRIIDVPERRVVPDSWPSVEPAQQPETAPAVAPPTEPVTSP